MNIGIVGAGALGTLFAADLARAHDVVILVRRTEVADALTRDGITVIDTGGGEAYTGVRATKSPRALFDREAVICAVKAYATRDALAPLARVLPANTLVTSLQNGIDFAADARAVLPQARIVAGSTTQGATLLAPGRVLRPNRGLTTLGDDTAIAPTSADVATAFSAAGLDARVDPGVERVLWHKLIVNAAINPLGALTGRLNGAIVDDGDLVVLARVLAEEAAVVARAEGVAVVDPWRLVEAAARQTAANRNSMLQDVETGRRTEIDRISGAIVQRAAAHGIPVPLTATMVRLIRARERAS